MTNYSRSVLLSNGFPYSKIRLKKFDFSPIDTPANIAKKLPSQRCSQPFLIAFSTSRTNGPRSLLQAKAGTHSAFRERSHTRAHAPKQGAFLSADTAWLCVASEIVTERTAGGSGCTPMACVRFLRRRGPAGLRDLFRFCRNCGLYALRSGPFRVCEARGGITTLSALYVLLKRRTAACQNGSFAVF